VHFFRAWPKPPHKSRQFQISGATESASDNANDSFQGTRWFHNLAEGFGPRLILLYHATCFLLLGLLGDRARDAITDRVDSSHGARANRAAFLIEQPIE
jgi:hypothetical protein